MAIGGLSMGIIIQKYGGTSLRSIYTNNDVLNQSYKGLYKFGK